MTQYGATERYDNGHYLIENVKPGGKADKAGIINGDTLVSINGEPIESWIQKSIEVEPGDTLILGFLRNNQEIGISIITGSMLSNAPWFFWPFYIFITLVSAGGLYILYKKPQDKASLLFFLYIQQFVILSIGGYFASSDPLIMLTSFVFLIPSHFLGPNLIHFHLIFPRPSRIISRYNRLPMLFYLAGFILFILNVYLIFFDPTNDSAILIFGLISLWWLTLTFLIALAIAIFQFVTIKDTLARNQLRIVVIGSVFGLITPMLFAIFYNYINDLWKIYPSLVQISQGIGSILLICSILIAIFRFRIWNIQVFIRKALLYFGATIFIILSYLLLLYLVDLLTIGETKVTRFIVLAVSIILFLMLRDRLQKLIDRVFHRETYDSATVVSEFEKKLAGIYRIDELHSRIGQCLNEIFHFKSFVINLRKEGLTYEPAYAAGIDHERITGEFSINPELENRLYKSKVFSPGELEHIPPFLEVTQGELVVPILKDDRPYGFFLCGPKKSEKTYSMQDIRVLSLIARRVIALFHTASLYQKDLDRQLMLERERARISQDMHDDVGASLTRISMMSDLVKNMTGIGEDARQWLGQISGTSREVTEEMDQIIWALNPKNDNLEGLAGYIRRFASEYLEPTPIECVFNFPEEMPDWALSVEERRNIYLVIRESLHNVAKHSGATRVELKLKVENLRFKISVKDNGHGFELEKLEFPGNGIVNMKKRMNDIGGEIFIRSAINCGTEIELVVSL
jgi:signal transduction histidine kinase